MIIREDVQRLFDGTLGEIRLDDIIVGTNSDRDCIELYKDDYAVKTVICLDTKWIDNDEIWNSLYVGVLNTDLSKFNTNNDELNEIVNQFNYLYIQHIHNRTIWDLKNGYILIFANGIKYSAYDIVTKEQFDKFGDGIELKFYSELDFDNVMSYIVKRKLGSHIRYNNYVINTLILNYINPIDIFALNDETKSHNIYEYGRMSSISVHVIQENKDNADWVMALIIATYLLEASTSDMKIEKRIYRPLGRNDSLVPYGFNTNKIYDNQSLFQYDGDKINVSDILPGGKDFKAEYSESIKFDSRSETSLKLSGRYEERSINKFEGAYIGDPGKLLNRNSDELMEINMNEIYASLQLNPEKRRFHNNVVSEYLDEKAQYTDETIEGMIDRYNEVLDNLDLTHEEKTCIILGLKDTNQVLSANDFDGDSLDSEIINSHDIPMEESISEFIENKKEKSRNDIYNRHNKSKKNKFSNGSKFHK